MKRALTVIGYTLCTLPPLLATLEFFPLWVTDKEKSISALSLLLIAICFVPLFRAYRRHVKSPSALFLWLLFFLFLSAFRAIIDELWCVSLIGLASAVPGALCLFFAKRAKPKK